MNIELNSIIRREKSYYMIMNVTACNDYIQVQRCSKKGKLYKYWNGFYAPTIQGLFNGVKYPDFELIRVGGNKDYANIEDGIESGKKKRRILFLQHKIEAYTKELNKLLIT